MFVPKRVVTVMPYHAIIDFKKKMSYAHLIQYTYNIYTLAYIKDAEKLKNK